MTGYGKGGLALAAAALLVAQPAAAATGCWNSNEVAAAKVRDLQSRLMVSALRCRAMGYDMLAAYNAFVTANRETIQGANGVIKARLSTGIGAAAGQSAYDAFATALANAYGGAATSHAGCDADAATASAAAMAAGDITALLALEDKAGPQPDLPGEACPVTFASLGQN